VKGSPRSSCKAVPIRKWLLTLNFGLFAIGCAYIAIPDIGRAASLGEHFLDVFLLVVAAIAAVASVLLLQMSRSAARFALDAGIGCVIVATLLLGGQWVQKPDTYRLLLWGSIWLVQALIVVDLLRLGARPRYPRAVAGAIGVSTALALFQFWYASDYQPRHASGELTLTLTLTRGADRAGVTDIAGRIVAENKSNVRLRVPASVFYLTGFSSAPQDSAQATPSLDLKSLLTCDYPKHEHYAVTAIKELDAGRLFSWDTWLEAKTQVDYRFVSYVPTGRYNFLELGAWATTAQGRLFQDEVDSHRWDQVADDAATESWRLKDTSRLDRLLVGERRTVVEWRREYYPPYEDCPDVEGDEFPAYDVQVTGAGDRLVGISYRDSARWGNYYRVATSSAFTQLAL
jgi:hypothetical protein